MRRWLLPVILLGGLLAAAPAAQAGVPKRDYTDAAKRFARAYWEVDRGEYTSCNYVRVQVVRAPTNTLGYVRWDRKPCVIRLTKLTDWSLYGSQDSWWEVCRVVMHEWGHLPGIKAPHNAYSSSVMNRTREGNESAWWWPHFPACRYDGDDADEDGYPDW